MRKRKPVTTSKSVRGRKIGAQPQRTKQDVVRGPKSISLDDLAAASPESLGTRKPETPVVQNETSVSQHEVAQIVTSNNSRNESDHFSAIAYAQAYHAKLFEIAQANVQLALEFLHRIAGASSPFEILPVLVEFTSKPIDMLQKYSREIAELNTGRLL